MSGRIAALCAAAGCLALVFAQDVAPGWAGYHTWQYAAALVIGMIAVFGYLQEARHGRDGEDGRRFVIPAIGVLVIGAAGLISGLLGADTETVARAPGTVAPLPAIGKNAAAPIAGPDDIARGDEALTLRQRNGTTLAIEPGRGRYVGANVLRLVPQRAAYVTARDPRGNHLTVTQPTNPSFLSPVLLFPQTVPIAGKDVPSDAFAAPAVHRQIKAFYFAKGAAGTQHAASVGSGAALLFAVDDDAGRLIPGAIGFAPSGHEVLLGGLRLQASLGTYPALEVSAVPYPLALWFGVALVLAGGAYAANLVPPWRKKVTGGGPRAAAGSLEA
jgi:hypothetical protein